jgi:hypothetical protein
MRKGMCINKFRGDSEACKEYSAKNVEGDGIAMVNREVCTACIVKSEVGMSDKSGSWEAYDVSVIQVCDLAIKSSWSGVSGCML